MRSLRTSKLSRSRRVARALKKRQARTAKIVRKAGGKVAMVAAVTVPKFVVTMTDDLMRRLTNAGNRVSLVMPRAYPSSIKVGKRFRKDYGDLDALARSMENRGGPIRPIAVTPEGDLIAGERTLRAWDRSGFKGLPIPINIINIDSIVAGEWDENAPGIRKDFTLSEAVAIADALAPKLKAKAVERMKAGKAAGAATPQDAGRAADQVAGLVGMDRKTLDKAKAVVAAARAEPEKFGGLLEQMDRTGRAHGPFNRLVNIQQADRLRAAPPALPGQGPYICGVIDVPWASEPDGASPSDTGRGYYKYPTMNTAELIGTGDHVLPLLDPAGGHFWFWVTDFHLLHGHAFKVLDAWSAKAAAAGLAGGIRRIGMRTWCKDKMGRGQVFRGQTEHVILCAFGASPPALPVVLSTRLDGPVRGDSEKPEQFYADVEAATPAPRYFELFARRQMPERWDGHGDQVGTLGQKIVEARAAKVTKAAPRFVSFGNISKGLLDVLGAIERGEPIDFNPNDHVVKGLTVGTRKRKLTRAGSAKLAELRDAAERLRLAARAPLGEVPGWGQSGMFMLDLDGTPYLVAVDNGGYFGVHAVDPDKPFGSEAGFRSFMGGELCSFDRDSDLPPAVPVDEFCRREIEQWLSGADEEDRKKRGKPIKRHRPRRWYCMPASWADTDGDHPPVSIGCLMFERGVLVALAGNSKIPQLPEVMKHLRDYNLIDDKGKVTKRGTGRIKELDKEIAAAKAAQPAAADAPPQIDPHPASLFDGVRQIEAGATVAPELLAQLLEHKLIRGAKRRGVQRGQVKLTEQGRALLASGAGFTAAAGPDDLAEWKAPGEASVPEAAPLRAASVRAQADAKVIAGAHVEVRINSHRALWTAFDLISRDTGAGSGYASYPVPQANADGLDAIEAALATLLHDELEAFAIGEQGERDTIETIKARSPDLARAHALLGAFARGWWKADDEPPAAIGNVEDDQLEIPAFLRRTAPLQPRREAAE